MRMRLLIVGADLSFRARLARFFQAAGYGVELAENPAQALRIGRKVALAVVATTDRDLGVDQLIEELQVVTGRPVVLVAQSRAAQRMPDVIDAADDAAILARVAQVLAPAPAEEAEPVLRFAGYSFDQGGHSLVDQDGREIKLTRSEFALLREFLRRPGRVLSRDYLLQALSGRQAETYDRSIDMLVVRLRRKIETDPKKPSLIVAVPGGGYKLTVDVKHLSGVAAYGEAATVERRVPGHRRQVTVVAAELLPAAGRRLPEDPEELHILIEDFRKHATDVCQQFGGSVARHAAREVTIFFGYPSALEDLAERALSAGLALAAPIHGDKRVIDGFTARVGIATGLVMVDTSGELIGSALSEAGQLEEFLHKLAR